MQRAEASLRKSSDRHKHSPEIFKGCPDHRYVQLLPTALRFEIRCSRPLCFHSIVISQRFHSISIFFCPSLNARLFFSFVTSFPGAQSRNYIWATNTPDDTELYGSSLRYPVEQTGAPYNLA
jgi:hypothetical protein